MSMQFRDEPLSNIPSNFPNVSDCNVSLIASMFSLVLTVSNVSWVHISLCFWKIFLTLLIIFSLASFFRSIWSAFISSSVIVSFSLTVPGALIAVFGAYQLLKGCYCFCLFICFILCLVIVFFR